MGQGRAWAGSSGSGASWAEPHRGAARAVEVPDLVGLDLSLARRAILAEGLVFAVPDASVTGRPAGLAGLVVVAQQPEPGTWLRTDSADARVTVWFEERPGDAGVREPRRPVPPRWQNRTSADPD